MPTREVEEDDPKQHGAGNGPWRPPPYTPFDVGGEDEGSPIRTEESGLEDEGKEIKLLLKDVPDDPEGFRRWRARSLLRRRLVLYAGAR